MLTPSATVVAFFIGCDHHPDKTILAEELSPVPLELIWEEYCAMGDLIERFGIYST